MFYLLFWLFLYASVGYAGTKGIYLTQSSVENTKFLNYLIGRSKAVGIDTFVADLNRASKKYAGNIGLLKENNITYVARIVVFPYGGTPEKIQSRSYWEKRYELIKQAIAYGANQIQLDYIRYDTVSGGSHEHAKNIDNIIKFYKERLAAQNIPLQIDVFGISSFGEEKHIGQNIKLFSQTVDQICPMVYPSHYVPFDKHAATPYETIYDSLAAIKNQFNNDKLPMKLVPFIELSNYHYSFGHEKLIAYIRAQLRAVKDSGVDGWYAWSAHNRYENLFYVLENHSVQQNK